MAACGNGKFCSQCEEKVVDFTNFSDAAIADYFAGLKDENVCGRFYVYQLQDKEFYYHPPMILPYKNWLIAAGVAALTVVGVEAKAQAPRTGSHVFPTVKQSSNTSQPIVVGDTLIIRGEVWDSFNSEVINSSVVLWEGNESLVGTISDFDGKYELRVPIKMLSGAPVRLICNYLTNKVEIPVVIEAHQRIIEQSFTIDVRRVNEEMSGIVVGRLKKIKKNKRRR